ncbi:MAG: hypothetical protein SGI97_07060 [candidate division Zixibacteria bacterium]|nr:hypothetical protein [candidate division Zixibacteria bacterium]
MSDTIELSDIKSYHDLKRLFGKESVQAVVRYIAWHNRLTMTPIITVWQAVSMGYFVETRALDLLFYSTVKRFWDGKYGIGITSLEECRAMARELEGYLYPAE